MRILRILLIASGILAVGGLGYGIYMIRTLVGEPPPLPPACETMPPSRYPDLQRLLEAARGASLVLDVEVLPGRYWVRDPRVKAREEKIDETHGGAGLALYF